MALVLIVAAGCVPSARNSVKKANPLESVIPSKEAAALQADVSGNDARKQSESASLASIEAQWPALSEAASPENQAASKLNSKGNPQEIGKVRRIALALIRKTENVKAIKICHAAKADEWWFTLYHDSGSFYELEQHVWNVLKEAPEPFLVPKRIAGSQLKTHLAASEPGRICQAFETADSSMSVDRDDSEKATAQVKAATPKPSDRTSAAATSAGPDRKLSKFSSQKQAEIPAAQPKIVPKPPSPVPAAVNKPEIRPAVAEPESRKPPAHADLKPPSSARKAASETTSEQTGTKEAKATSQARRANRTDDSKPTCQVFVYGSSMNHTELMSWLDDNGYDASLVVDATPAKLEGYDFVWNYFSPSRGGGTVNLERKANSHVLGLLIEIEDSLLKAFDAKEGHPKYYARRDTRVPVKRLEDGKTVFAWLYIANPNKGTKRDIWPTAEYKQKILQAASFWGLPEAYTAKIKSWRSR